MSVSLLFWATLVRALGPLGAPAATPAPLAEAGLAAPGEQARVRGLVQEAVKGVMADPSLTQASVSVAIERLDDQLELFAHHGDQLLVPASNVKIVTTAAALSLLSPDHQFVTEVFGTYAPSGEVLGDLYVKGYGDPYLLPERVWHLCSRLRFLGIDHVKGDLVVDDSYFEGERQAYGWQADHTDSAYMAPTGALSVGFNAVLIHILPGAKPLDDARIFVDPQSNYGRITGRIATVAHGRTSVSADIVPGGPEIDHRDVVRVHGNINVNDSPRGLWRRINNPPMFAGEVFRTTCEQVGIKVDGKVAVGRVPETTPMLLQYQSPRLSELLGPLNKYSNNFMAAQVAYAMGAAVLGPPGTWEKGRAAIETFLNEHVRLTPGSYTLRNASGLHEVNLFSARQIVRVLSHMRKQPRVWPEFVNSLAVAGGIGTLQDRMQHTRATRVLRGKTGTLAGACALSGYVPTRDGQLLAFSMLVNGFRRVDLVWAAQDRLADALAGLDLGPLPDGGQRENLPPAPLPEPPRLPTPKARLVGPQAPISEDSEAPQDEPALTAPAEEEIQAPPERSVVPPTAPTQQGQSPAP